MSKLQRKPQKAAKAAQKLAANAKANTNAKGKGRRRQVCAMLPTLRACVSDLDRSVAVRSGGVKRKRATAPTKAAAGSESGSEFKEAKGKKLVAERPGANPSATCWATFS